MFYFCPILPFLPPRPKKPQDMKYIATHRRLVPLAHLHSNMTPK